MIIKARIKNLKKVQHIVIVVEGESLNLLEKIFALVWSSLVKDHTIEQILGRENSTGPGQLGYKRYVVDWPNPGLAMSKIMSDIKKDGKFDLDAGEVKFTFIAKANPKLAKIQVRRKE